MMEVRCLPKMWEGWELPESTAERGTTATPLCIKQIRHLWDSVVLVSSVVGESVTYFSHVMERYPPL
jgi:hypothetical protein